MGLFELGFFEMLSGTDMGTRCEIPISEVCRYFVAKLCHVDLYLQRAVMYERD